MFEFPKIIIQKQWSFNKNIELEGFQWILRFIYTPIVIELSCRNIRFKV